MMCCIHYMFSSRKCQCFFPISFSFSPLDRCLIVYFCALYLKFIKIYAYYRQRFVKSASAILIFLRVFDILYLYRNVVTNDLHDHKEERYMKTLVIAKDGSLSIQEVNKPRYNEYQALVKTIACGMCGTDVKLCHRTFKGLSLIHI